jgi:hypothetical protein
MVDWSYWGLASGVKSAGPIGHHAMELLRSLSSVSKATKVFELKTLLSELTTGGPRDTLPALLTASVAEFISVLDFQ